MKPERRKAREYLQNMRTVDELRKYLSILNLTEEQRSVAFLSFSKGWSRQKIALELNLSIRQVERDLQRVYDRMK